jgi:hypothetical protein
LTATLELAASISEIESVFAVLAARVRDAVARAATAARTTVREAL